MRSVRAFAGRPLVGIATIGAVMVMASCVPVREVDLGTFIDRAETGGPVVPDPPGEGFESGDGARAAGEPGSHSVTLPPDLAPMDDE